jgi:hypothetical protein
MTAPGDAHTPPWWQENPTALTSLAVDQAKSDLRREIQALRDYTTSELQCERELRTVGLTSEHDLRLLEHHALENVVVALNTASSAALSAALQAAKEANTKQELAFTKQIDAIGTLIQSAANTQDARTKALEGRLDRGEGLTQGVDKSGADFLSRLAIGIAALSASGSVMFLIVAVATHGKF